MWYQVVILVLAIGGSRFCNEKDLISFFQGYFYFYTILFIIGNVVLKKLYYEVNKQEIIKKVLEEYDVEFEDIEIEEDDDMYSYITSVMNEIVKIILVAIILFFILKMDIYLI